MRPTIRGATAVAIVATAFALAVQYTPRALNAMVTPLLVVLVVGAVTTIRVDRPELRRAPVDEGFVGERRRVAVEIETDSAVAATVRDTVGEGVTTLESERTAVSLDDGEPVVATTLEGDDRVSYEVRLEERGEHAFGPLTITVTDVFGLFKRTFTYDATSTVLVYPRIRELQRGPGRGLEAVVDERHDREEFDHLREYQRGDSLRDVHWKSAAKRPDDDLVVTEYTTDDDRGSVTVAAECTPGRADELATAVASVATDLLETGVDVGLSLPSVERPPRSGQDHHYDLLADLAVLEADELADEQREAADLLVQADVEGTRVVVDDRSIPFERLTSGARSGGSGASATGTGDRSPELATDGGRSAERATDGGRTAERADGDERTAERADGDEGVVS